MIMIQYNEKGVHKIQKLKPFLLRLLLWWVGVESSWKERLDRKKKERGEKKVDGPYIHYVIWGQFI